MPRLRPLPVGLAFCCAVTRSQGILEDPGEEINSLASRLKNDTKFLKIELDQLAGFLASNRSQVGSANATDHSQTVVDTMRLQLQSATLSFKTVLEESQNTMKKKSDRRGMFGSNRAPLSGALPSTTPLAAFQQQQQLSPAVSPPVNTPPLPVLGLSPAQQQQQMQHQQSAPGTFGQQHHHASSGLVDDLGEPMPLIAANQVQQDDRYLSSRAEAMSSIESHIVELGEVFHQLAHMVAEQGQLVTRIDDNVRDTQMNLSAGHDQLMQTWQGMSGNKMLAAKLVAVLLFFITFFITFLA